MPAPSVRFLSDEPDLRRAAWIVNHGMLAPIDDDRLANAVERYMTGGRVLGAVDATGTMCGTARSFDTEVRTPGGSVAAAAVSGVAVLPTHRRQGHLRRLMGTLLDDAVDAGKPVSVLIAAEWPIYGRYGYGPATQACGWEVDARTASFRRPATGSVRLLSGEELRPLVDPIFEGYFERQPGTLRREPRVWDWICGLVPSPGEDTLLLRFAAWDDDDGVAAGFVTYRVEDRWTHNRPDASVTVDMLLGATPRAEVELWRHLCELDWVSTVRLGPRSVDDAVPLELVDSRAAACVDVSDGVWLRVLDVPAAFEARRAAVAGAAVVDVVDEGPAAGRWRLELGPDGADITKTDEPADVRLPASALGAVYLGGTSAERLARAGWLDEEAVGGAARLDALLASRPLPFNPTGF